MTVVRAVDSQLWSRMPRIRDSQSVPLMWPSVVLRARIERSRGCCNSASGRDRHGLRAATVDTNLPVDGCVPVRTGALVRTSPGFGPVHTHWQVLSGTVIRTDIWLCTRTNERTGMSSAVPCAIDRDAVPRAPAPIQCEKLRPSTDLCSSDAEGTPWTLAMLGTGAANARGGPWSRSEGRCMDSEASSVATRTASAGCELARQGDQGFPHEPYRRASGRPHKARTRCAPNRRAAPRGSALPGRC